MNTENWPLSANEIEKLNSKLKALSEKNKSAPLLLSSRCALRVFPVIFEPNNGFCTYWQKQKRAENLLSVWWAILLVYFKEKINRPHSSFIDAAAFANGAAQEADSYFHSPSLLRASAVPSTIYAAAFSCGSAAYDDFSDLLKSIRNAYSVALEERLLPYELLEIEIASLEGKEVQSVIDYNPLWDNLSVSSRLYQELVDKYLPEALSQLAEQSRESDPEAVQIIEEIYPIYRGIYEGKPDQRRIAQALDQLDLYFSDIEKAAPDILFSLRDSDYEVGSESVSDESNEASIETRYKATLSQNAHKLAKEDKLDRTQLINTLSSTLLNSSNTHHQTIGLLGHWGAGKSSVVHLLKEQLLAKQQEQPFLFAEFNAWEYEHTDNLQAGIAQEMLKALTSPTPAKRIDRTRPIKGILTYLWQCVRKKPIWWLQRFILTICFAIRMQGIKLLYPLALLGMALLPIWLRPLLDLLEPLIPLRSLFQPVADLLDSSKDWFKTLVPLVWSGGFLYPLWQQTKKVLAEPMAKELRTYLKLPDYAKHLGMIPVMREHIKKLAATRLNWVGIPWFKQNKKGEFELYPRWTLRRQKRLLYVVDDLDRCNHKSIVKVLEAVRMVLDLDYVTVIIAVDQRIALAALALHYKELETYHPTGDARQIARDYLAKVILQPIQLTEPDQPSVESYLDDLWGKTTPDHQKVQTSPSEEELKADNTDNTKSSTPPSSGSSVRNDALASPISDPEPKQTDIEAEDNDTIGSDTTTSTESEDNAEIVYLERLTDAQQKAFKHWIKHFELTNPRQLKRLNNSYNFLRNYYTEDQVPREIKDSKVKLSEYDFPMLATLCALEFINNLVDKNERTTLKAKLTENKTPALNDEQVPEDGKKLTENVIELAHFPLTTNSGVMITYKAVEPFVLPALDDVKRY